MGHVFQGRYKSILVDKESYGLELSRYIVLNPVRAQMVKRVADWAWEQLPRHCGPGDGAGADSITDWVLGQMGGRHPVRAYERFVQEGLVRNSPWNRLQGQIWLGDEAFLKRMQRLAAGKAPANVPRSQRHPARPNADAVTALVLSAYGMRDEKRLRSRGHQEAFQGWIYLLRRVADLPLLEVAKRSGVSPSRISKIQRTIEIANPPVLSGNSWISAMSRTDPILAW